MSKNFSKLKKMLIVMAIACIALTMSSTQSFAANQAGGKCTKVGATSKAGKTTLKCTKVGKNLVWVAVKASGATTTNSPAIIDSALTSQSQIPAIIENWGFNFGDYSAATGKAGDMQIRGLVPPVFTGATAVADNAAYRLILGPIGQVMHGIVEPQNGFILPLGTAVISMVTGTVCDLPKLYSNDYSIRVAPPGMKCMQGGSYVMYEHEHVLNPLVSVGDKVTAGQKIAIVSDFNQHWKAKGYGTLETGVFFSKVGSGRPWHACLSSSILPAKKTAMLATLTQAYAAWEAELGDSTLYDVAAMPIAGCYTLAEMTE